VQKNAYIDQTRSTIRHLALFGKHRNTEEHKAVYRVLLIHFLPTLSSATAHETRTMPACSTCFIGRLRRASICRERSTRDVGRPGSPAGRCFSLCRITYLPLVVQALQLISNEPAHAPKPHQKRHFFLSSHLELDALANLSRP
jgi:hypothetical protein